MDEGDLSVSAGRLYHLGLNRQDARFAQDVAFERRQSVGTRLFGSRANVDWSVEGAFQFGSLGNSDIRAWALSSETSYTFSDRTWKPRLGPKADALYAPPLNPVAGTSGTQSRYVGQQLIASIEWAGTLRPTVAATYVHFEPGGVTRQAGSRSGEFFATWLQFRF